MGYQIGSHLIIEIIFRIFPFLITKTHCFLYMIFKFHHIFQDVLIKRHHQKNIYSSMFIQLYYQNIFGLLMTSNDGQ